MQAVLKMIRFLVRLAYRALIVYVIFLILAWVLLGIHPRDGFAQTTDRIRGAWYRVTGFAGDVKEAGAGLKDLGERHLKDAQDRYHGIDPYEKYNNQLNQNMHNAE